MATLASFGNFLSPKVVEFLKAPLPVGLPPPLPGTGYEVGVTAAGEPFRTGELIPTGITKKGGLQIALEAISPLTSVFSGPTGVTAQFTKSLVGSFVNQQTTKPEFLGRPIMGFADGDSGFFGISGLPDLGQIFQGQVGRDLLGIGTQALSGFVQQQFAPQPVSFPGITQAAAMPAIIRGGAMVGRSFFNRFPALATAIQGFRNVGQNVTRANLWSLMKRFGPDFLITGGILSAAAVNELAIAGPGRRRMNPGNVKALRKAHRRMKSFHNICVTNDRLLGGRRRSKARGFAAGTQITQVK